MELDFSRAVNVDLKAAKDMAFDAVLVFARDDETEVDFGSDNIIFAVADKWNDTDIVNWSQSSGLSVSTATITFGANELNIDDLDRKVYDYILYDNTNKRAIAYGEFEVI